MATSERKKAWLAGLERLGLCAYGCGRPRRAGNRLCQAHWEMKWARLEELKRGKMCVDGCGRPAAPGRTLCAVHLCRGRARCERLAARGLCTRCGEQPPRAGRKQCPACLGKSVESTRRHRAVLVAGGFCAASCGRPAVPGTTLCAAHTARSRQYHRDAKAAVMDRYGGGRCRQCGEARLAMLELHHPDNDGAAHRQLLADELGRWPSSTEFYRWLARGGFPDRPRLEVLCTTCHAEWTRLGAFATTEKAGRPRGGRVGANACRRSRAHVNENRA